MSVMDTVTACRLLYCLENLIDVNDPKAAGEPLWPYFRLAFCVLFVKNDTAVSTLSEDNPARRLKDAVDPLYEQLTGAGGGTERPAETFLPPPAFHVPNNKWIVVYTRPEEHFQRDEQGVVTAPTLDPWVEAANRWGPTTKLELRREAAPVSPPRAFPTLWLAHRNESAAPLPPDLTTAAETLVQRVQKAVGLYFKISLPPLENALISIHRDSHHFARLLEEGLRALDASVVLFTCFYHAGGFGLCLAARRLGIPIIEVQHGLNGYHHWGYTHWSAIPEAGYPVLPTHFATWDTRSARNINRWHPDGPGVPRTRVVGRFDEDGTEAPPSAALTAFRTRHEKVILVTLQSMPELALNERMIRLIKAAPSSWGWLLRLHPLSANQPIPIRFPAEGDAFLKAHGIENATVTEASSARLLDALRVSDHHVTHFSSTVLEALMLGIPSTCINPVAQGAFADLFQNNTARLALTDPEIIAAIAAGWDGLNRPPASDFPRFTENRRRAMVNEALATRI